MNKWLCTVIIGISLGANVLGLHVNAESIDFEPPYLEAELYCGEQKIDGWFSEEKGELQLIVIATDTSGIDEVTISRDEFFQDVIEKRNYDGQTSIRDEIDSFCKGEQNATYYIKVTDVFGNSSAQECNVMIDNTKPSDDVLVKFSGDGNINVNVTNLQEDGCSYHFSQANGEIVSNDIITLQLCVKDAKAGETIASGIHSIEFPVSIETIDSQMSNLLKFSEGDITYDENGDAYVSYETKIKEEDSVVEANFYIGVITVTDRAGNIAVISPGEDAEGGVQYGVDNKKPEFEFIYNNDVEPYKEENDEEMVYYYDSNYLGHVVIKDKNIDRDSIEIENENTDKYAQPDIGAGMEDSNVYIHIPFVLGKDGEYKILARADDLYQNRGIDNEKPSASSSIMVVDTMSPVIRVGITNQGGQEVSDYADRYFNTNMFANIQITEKNLKTILIEVAVTEPSGAEELQRYTENEFTVDGDKYNYQLSMEKEGKYEITVSCMDKVGHEAALKTEHFYIDKTPPIVNISYDNMDARNGFYYNNKRIATISVEDFSFDDTQCDFRTDTVLGTTFGALTWIAEGKNQYAAKVVFEKDDIYDVAFQCTDKAGNKSEEIDGGHFVVDTEAPILNIWFDNNDVENQLYYKKGRIASVEVKDLSFDEALFRAAKTDREGLNDFMLSQNWISDSVRHTTRIFCTEEGKYEFVVEAEDLAGNKSSITESGFFVVDKTVPKIKIDGIMHKSANNGVVAPQIYCDDKNLNIEKTFVDMNGFKNGTVNRYANILSSKENYTVLYKDIPRERQLDDMYTLQIHVEDMAGNYVEEQYQFSVNRYGSVYSLDDETTRMIQNYYINQEQNVVIIETNVDNLAEEVITVNLDGELKKLKKGRDYEIVKQGDDATWKSFTYTINKKNFVKEGQYVVTLLSKDVANNQTDSNVQDKTIAFAVDKTGPGIAVSGIEDNGIYQQENLKVNANIQDNMCLKEVNIYRNEQKYKSYGREELEETYGTITFTLSQSDEPIQLQIEAIDEVGNTTIKEYNNVLITTKEYVINDEVTARSVEKERERLQMSRKIGRSILIGTCLGIVCSFGFIILRHWKKEQNK